ncbi:MAG: hypothetical protein ABI480_17985 [Chitinophagaceae bacterium]
METTLIIYPSYHDRHPLLEEIEEQLNEQNLVYYASCLLEKGLPDEDELEAALQKAIMAVLAAGLFAHCHFRKIFVWDDHEMKTDWLVSDLGLRLILMNANVSNPLVARWQVEIISNMLN